MLKENILKYLYWDLTQKSNLRLYLFWLIRNIPGEFGFNIRQMVFTKNMKKVGNGLVVMPGTVIIHPENIILGDNVHIGDNNYIQAGGGLTVGSDTLFGPYVKIWTQNHKYDPDALVSKQGYDKKMVVIGNDVWIGAGVFIMPGTIIGDKCIISACSVVAAKDYPPRSILAGHPARKINTRE